MLLATAHRYMFPIMEFWRKVDEFNGGEGAVTFRQANTTSVQHSKAQQGSSSKLEHSVREIQVYDANCIRKTLCMRFDRSDHIPLVALQKVKQTRQRYQGRLAKPFESSWAPREGKHVTETRG